MKKILFIASTIFITSPVASQTASTYEVYAIQFARAAEPWPAKNIAIDPNATDSVRGVFMIWLLKNEKRNILVDAGFLRESRFIGDWVQEYVRPDSALQNLGIHPGEITDVIVSHPHWDHAGGMDLFPNATIWMQKKDYSYFVTDAWQPGGKTEGFDSLDVSKLAGLNAQGRLKLIDGDGKEIIPGIKVYIGSKHTYESQFVVTNTSTDKVLIASDNCWFYYNLDHMVSIPLTFDPKAYVRSLQRMRTLVKPGLIIPGHDAKVFERFTKAGKGAARIR